jgi:hypothetical protein
VVVAAAAAAAVVVSDKSHLQWFTDQGPNPGTYEYKAALPTARKVTLDTIYFIFIFHISVHVTCTFY